MVGKAHARVSISEGAAIEQKIDFLLRQVDNLQTSIEKIDDRVDEVESSITNKTKEISIELENLKTSLGTIISGHIIGDYDKNLFGIIITMCGTIIQFFST